MGRSKIMAQKCMGTSRVTHLSPIIRGTPNSMIKIVNIAMDNMDKTPTRGTPTGTRMKTSTPTLTTTEIQTWDTNSTTVKTWKVPISNGRTGTKILAATMGVRDTTSELHCES